MPNIISPEQSFVQFSPPDLECNNYPEICLPVVANFDISFQFIVAGGVEITDELRPAIASIDCELIEDLVFSAANITSLCNKRVIEFPEGTFFLHQIKFNGVLKVYDLDDVDASAVMEIIETDFEATILGSAILECCDNEVIVDINQLGSFSDDFNTDFDNGGPLTLSTFVAWHQAYFNLSNIPITILSLGNCFRYAVVQSDDTILGCSNCFSVSDDRCFTTFLTYQNNEDAFGFQYGTGIYNRIRLPFYLRAPTTPATRKVYRKSNGFYKTQSVIYDRQYSLLTDWLPDWFHEKMAIAVGHDYVKMDNSLFKVSSEVSVDGYSPDWQDDDTFLLAMGKASVKHAKYSYRNDSCGSIGGCSDYVPPGSGPCVAVFIEGSPALPDAVIGTAYDFTITPGGTGPFGIAAVVKPDWMTIAISGTDILFSGIPGPGTAGDDITVSFTITNACGSVNYSHLINTSIGASGVMFGPTTFVSGDSLHEVEVANIVGVPGSTITVTLDHTVNNNGGSLKVNGSAAFEGNTWAIVLDGSGNGILNVEIAGVSNPTTAILGHFTITATTAGAIGSPYSYQISKAF